MYSTHVEMGRTAAELALSSPPSSVGSEDSAQACAVPAARAELSLPPPTPRRLLDVEAQE